MEFFKKISILSILILIISTSAYAGNARLQVIHNAADPAAEVVDIYVNGDLYEDDFTFRAATEFRTVPAGVELNIGVAPGNSGSADDVIATIPITLEARKTYVAIANGVLDPDAFAENPDGMGIGFNLYATDRIYERTFWNRWVKIIAFHGASDAPTVDIRRSGKYYSWNLFDNLSYGEFSSYRTLSAREYVLDVTPGNDKNTVVASFKADLTGLGGGAAVVFASGFLNPTANQDGPAFGLFAALPNGDVVALPPAMEMARLQVIHNAADPAAEVVDIYVNGDLFKDDFAFRTATEFMNVPAGVELNIGVAPGTSTSANDIIATIPVTLMAGKTYVAIANGVLDPNSFAGNPDGKEIGFNLYARDGIREKAQLWYETDFVVFHGSTDAPTVDVVARDVGTIVDNAAYGDFTDYLSVKPKKYILDITPGNDNNTIVASFEADLSGLKGGAAVVFASGFLTPEANQDGPAFGLFAALPTGDVVELPPYTPTARLQVIHNAADPAAEVVDIYVNGGLYEDNFAFRAATEFRTVPAGVELNIGVAPGNSSSADDAIATIPVTLTANKTYVAIANGVLNPGDFADNPDGNSIAFNLFAVDGIHESAIWKYFVDIIAFHGATDAPEVDIILHSGWFKWRLFDNLEYGEFSDYRYLLPFSFYLNVTPAGDNSTVVATFKAELNGLGGGAAVVFASGFLNPANNQDGPAFGLFAALPNGQVVELMPVSGGFAANKTGDVDDALVPAEFKLNQNYPNPFNPSTTISFALPQASNVTLKVYNVIGQTVKTLVNEQMEAGEHQVTFDASNISSGMYFYRLDTDSFSETKKMVLLK